MLRLCLFADRHLLYRGLISSYVPLKLRRLGGVSEAGASLPKS
jgi:hypothetical protein